VELEGLVEYVEGVKGSAVLFRPCGGSESYCMVGNHEEVWECTGSYVRMRGYFETMEDGASFIGAGCTLEVVKVVEVLEARECAAGDCGGTECGTLECGNACQSQVDCPAGYKCVPWAAAGHTYLGTRCAQVQPAAVGPGQPCEIDDSVSWQDSCDETSVCVGLDPASGIGTCTSWCGYEKGALEACSGDAVCFQVRPYMPVNYCAPACNPLAPDCDADQQCTLTAAFFGCLYESEVPLIDHDPTCGTEASCADAEVCADAQWLNSCTEDSCCTPVCDPDSPNCPDNLPCTEWYQGGPPTLAAMGVCTNPP
jgi:hypothetical protein